MKIYILVLIFSFPLFVLSKNNDIQQDSTRIITPEGIGQYLSEVLINRGDIKESPIAINIDQLLPNEDLSKYEDSPAEFILAILATQQTLLPQSWEELLFQADSLHIDKNTKYVKTYFSQTHKDQFRAIAVIEISSKYYALAFNIIEWENKKYVLRIDDQLKGYNTLDDLKKDSFYSEKPFDINNRDVFDEKVISNSNKRIYHYNAYPFHKVNETSIPTLDPFIESLTTFITHCQDFDTVDIFVTASNLLKIIPSIPDPLITDEELRDIKKNILNSEQGITDTIELRYNKELEKLWENLLSSINEKKHSNLSLKNTSLSNIYFENRDIYDASLTYKFNSDNESYVFSCYAILIDGKWKLMNISPIEGIEDPIFQF